MARSDHISFGNSTCEIYPLLHLNKIFAIFKVQSQNYGTSMSKKLPVTIDFASLKTEYSLSLLPFIKSGKKQIINADWKIPQMETTINKIRWNMIVLNSKIYGSIFRHQDKSRGKNSPLYLFFQIFVGTFYDSESFFCLSDCFNQVLKIEFDDNLRFTIVSNSFLFFKSSGLAQEHQRIESFRLN